MDSQKKEWGCEGDAPIPFEFDHVETTTCPRRPVKDNRRWFSDIFTHVGHYRNGFLPVAGGIEDQPYKLMKLIEIVVSVADEAAEGKAEEERKKNARLTARGRK